MKVQEAIEIVNNGHFYSLYDAECVIGYEPIRYNDDITHCNRFVVTSSFYELEDGILGIRGLSEIEDETLEAEDIQYISEAFEAEMYTTIEFIRKEK